jgi:hypothetical protein
MASRIKTMVALQSFAAEINGKQVVVLAGARFQATDPVVRDHPSQFEPYDEPR